MLDEEMVKAIPKATEILTLHHMRDTERAREVVNEYSLHELRMITGLLAAMAGGLLNAAYSCTELPQDQWMSHFATEVQRMFYE